VRVCVWCECVCVCVCKFVLFCFHRVATQLQLTNISYRIMSWPVGTTQTSSSSSYICHAVGPLVDPFRSHVSRSLFKVYHDSFCQLWSSISLPCLIYFEAFYVHVVSSFSCIPVICPKLVLFVTPLQFVHLFAKELKITPILDKKLRLADSIVTEYWLQVRCGIRFFSKNNRIPNYARIKIPPPESKFTQQTAITMRVKDEIKYLYTTKQLNQQLLRLHLILAHSRDSLWPYIQHTSAV